MDESGLGRVIARVEQRMRGISADHDFYHCFDVFLLCMGALACIGLPTDAMFDVLLAAILHEVDDRKLFNTVDYAHARKIMLEELGYVSERCIRMISKVSTSANGICTDGPSWELLPSYADKCLSLGLVGIGRTLEYTLGKGQPLFTDATLRITTEEELRAISTARFADYKGNSVSMIDHFYDKLLYFAYNLHSGNTFLDAKIAEARQLTIEYVLYFGKHGSLMEL